MMAVVLFLGQNSQVCPNYRTLIQPSKALESFYTPQGKFISFYSRRWGQ